MKNKDKDFYKPTRCIIGIDQSYTCTGFAIYADGNLRLITSENFKGLKSKSLKREKVAEDVKKLIKTCKKYFKTNEITIIVERIRTFSQSPKNSKNLSISFIKAQAALVCTIVDVAYKHEIKVYSVDTRAWKKAILGTSKPLEKHMEGVKNPKKTMEIQYVINLGFEKEITRKNTKSLVYDDDAADAACIALYGNYGGPYKLLLEE